MLSKVKLALRISGSAFDQEVQDLINAAFADLRLVGILVPELGEGADSTGDPLLDRAVLLYAKANFGYLGYGEDQERYRRAYDYLKCALSLGGDYHG